jgi:Zn ribbon nucleic-acid-binding protein
MKLVPINLYNYSRFNKWIMNKFIRHLPCPRCKSKDNLGEYEDNFYCFGCGYYRQKKTLDVLRKRLKGTELLPTSANSIIIEEDIPVQAKTWLLKYGITNEEITKYGIGWCQEKELLVLIHNDSFWQGRNFATGPQHTKYLSSGSKEKLTFYGEGAKLIVVEDVLSAIKVARLSPDYCSLPLLGSSMPLEWSRIVSERFKWVRIWLDRDKAKESLKMARNLSERVLSSRSVITELDPKEYSSTEIREILGND